MEKIVKHTSERVKLPDGFYVFKILDIYDSPLKQYVCLVCDVAYGEYTDYFTEEYSKPEFFEKDKNRDNKTYLSYKDSNNNHYLRQKLDAISRSNPGFDAEDCWDRACDDPEVLKEFIGKKFGAKIKEKHIENKDGSQLHILNNFEFLTDSHLILNGTFGEAI